MVRACLLCLVYVFMVYFIDELIMLCPDRVYLRPCSAFSAWKTDFEKNYLIGAHMAKKSTAAKSGAKSGKSALSAPPKTEEPEVVQFEVSEEEFEGFEGFASTDEEDAAEPEEESARIDAKEKSKIAELAKKSCSADKTDTDTGVVYVGRIPHGLYEREMKEYFGQFGTISRIRISRNKESGKSKHYGFIEFESREAAAIVCEVMDNYLLFGHLLQVKPMEPNQVHESLWTGANQKFHAVPWGLVNSQRSRRKHPREYWEQKQEEFDQQRAAKARKLEELGIIY